MSDEIDRVDKILVRLGLFESRTAAQAAIAAGGVTVSGRVIKRPSEKIAMGAQLSAVPAHPYVSRAGIKLEHALGVFDVSVAGRHCLDIGASTGGFTEVLLHRGAASIVAVDVGRDQMHPKVSEDPRVRSLEAMDARHLSRTDVHLPPSLIVCDASFISLHKLLEVPLSLAASTADLIALFKPQFEVGTQFVGKGGIVSDAEAVSRAEECFCNWLKGQGWSVQNRVDSPIRGGDGNAERLVWAAKDFARE